MSINLLRRLEAAEAHIFAGGQRSILLFEPYGASAETLAAFQADITARQAENPQLHITVLRWQSEGD